MRSKCFLLTLSIVLYLTFPANSGAEYSVYLGTGPTLANQRSSLGINLPEPESYQPDYLFVDAALKARKWIAHSCDGSSWDTEKTITTDAYGWVTRVAEGICPGMVVLDAPGTMLGTYVLIWEGEGTLSAQLGPAAGLKCTSAKCTQTGNGGLQARSEGVGPHRATFELKTASTTITDLRLMSFNPARPIKNIRIVVPGGIAGKNRNNLNYKAYCKTARGPEGSIEQTRVTKPGPDETCFDFEQVFWDRFRDPLGQIQHPKVLFHPLTLAGLQGFRIIRGMDWMHINNSPVQSWSQRTTYKHQNQTESVQGPALEYLVALANANGSDLWINIPHLADDGYVNSFAIFLRNNLHPGLNVYVEYSNELWNDSFEQARWLLQQGQKRQLSDNPWTSRLRCQSERAVVIADNFRRVFTGQVSRVVNLLAGQAANADSGRELLSWKNAKSHFDAYAIAPYFAYALGSDAKVSAYNLDQVFQNFSSTALDETRTWIKSHIAMLKQIDAGNVRLVNYEAGPHLAGIGTLQDDERMTTLFTNANRDQRMQSALNDYLKILRNEGVNEICYYSYLSSYNKYGSWGARELETDDNAPKWRALQAFMQSEPCWWNNCNRKLLGGGNRVDLAAPPPAKVPSRLSTPAKSAATKSQQSAKSNQQPAKAKQHPVSKNR